MPTDGDEWKFASRRSSEAGLERRAHELLTSHEALEAGKHRRLSRLACCHVPARVLGAGLTEARLKPQRASGLDELLPEIKFGYVVASSHCELRRH